MRGVDRGGAGGTAVPEAGDAHLGRGARDPRIKGPVVVPDLYLLVGREAPGGLSAEDGLGLHSVSGRTTLSNAFAMDAETFEPAVHFRPCISSRRWPNSGEQNCRRGSHLCVWNCTCLASRGTNARSDEC